MLFKFMFVKVLLAGIISSLLISYGFAAEVDPELKLMQQLESRRGGQEIEGEEKIINRARLTYNARGLKDPFESYIQQEEKQEPIAEVEPLRPEKDLPSLEVKGLVWGGRMPQAIINDRVFEIGDIVEGAQIIEINKQGVKIMFENRMYELFPPALNSDSQKEEQRWKIAEE